MCRAMRPNVNAPQFVHFDCNTTQIDGEKKNHFKYSLEHRCNPPRKTFTIPNGKRLHDFIKFNNMRPFSLLWLKINRNKCFQPFSLFAVTNCSAHMRHLTFSEYFSLEWRTSFVQRKSVSFAFWNCSACEMKRSDFCQIMNVSMSLFTVK